MNHGIRFARYRGIPIVFDPLDSGYHHSGLRPERIERRASFLDNEELTGENSRTLRKALDECDTYIVVNEEALATARISASAAAFSSCREVAVKGVRLSRKSGGLSGTRSACVRHAVKVWSCSTLLKPGRSLRMRQENRARRLRLARRVDERAVLALRRAAVGGDRMALEHESSPLP